MTNQRIMHSMDIDQSLAFFSRYSLIFFSDRSVSNKVGFLDVGPQVYSLITTVL